MGKKQKSIEAVIPEQLESEPSYYAVIPANVRYDKKLTANAKLLYGEITALCNKRGYCWQGNSRFAKLYKVSKVSISKWVRQLKEQGYISITFKYKNGSKEIEERRISITEGGGIKEKFNTPIKEKFKENIKVINNKDRIKTGKSEKSTCQNAFRDNSVNTIKNNDDSYKIGKEMNRLLNRVMKIVKKIPNETLSSSITLEVRNRLCSFLYRYEIDIGKIEEVLTDYIICEIDHSSDWDFVIERLNNYLDPNYEEPEEVI